jgi:hypothetical protein
MVLFVSLVALSVGGFIAISPTLAARIWGWKNFESLAPKPKVIYLRSFRVMGITLALAGFLLALDSFWFH